MNESKKGQKFDGGKIRPTLLPIDSLKEITNVLEFGARKYTENGWQSVPNAKQRYMDALLRHLWAFIEGEERDPETDLPHLAHAGCNILFLLHLHGKGDKPEWPEENRIDAIGQNGNNGEHYEDEAFKAMEVDDGTSN